LLFAYLFFVPYRALGRAVTSGDVAAAAGSMGRIRPVMVINLSLGIFITLLGVSGGGIVGT
jgi:uncharacterized membrane protein